MTKYAIYVKNLEMYLVFDSYCALLVKDPEKAKLFNTLGSAKGNLNKSLSNTNFEFQIDNLITGYPEAVKVVRDNLDFEIHEFKCTLCLRAKFPYSI